MTSTSIRLRFWAAIILGVVTLTGLARAQVTTADILGTVTDKSGGVIAGATVTLKNLATGAQRTTETSTNGNYAVNLLSPGTYSVTISSAGFETFRIPSLTLAAGDRKRVDAELTLGAVSQTVTVEAQATALETDSSVLSATINSTETQNLPLNGRNFIQLVQLQPGVNEGPPDSLVNGGKLDDRRQTASFSVNGQSDVLNDQLLDGADNNERLIGTIGVRPSVEAISETRVETNTYAADAGQTAGGVVNVITKSGSNNFHGSVFEFFRNDIFDASADNLTGAPLPKNELRQNDFGASLGGPIVKDKTFFFGDYEGLRIVQGQSPQVGVVPTSFEQANPGDFSDIGQPNITGPIDPAGLDYFRMLPSPNTTEGGLPAFAGIPKFIQNSTDFDARVDHNFGSSDAVFARFTYNNVYTDTPGDLPTVTVAGVTLNPSFIGSGLGYAKDIDYNALLSYRHVFSSNLLFELKASYTRADNESYPVTEGLNPNEKFGQPNVNTPISDSSGLMPISFLGPETSMGSVLFQPLKDQDNTFQYMGSVNYTRGAHNIKFGAGIIRRQLTSFQSSAQEGFPLFANFQALLEGQIFTYALSRSLQLYVPHLRIWNPSAYFQDDWHATRRLTLNIGARYDYYSPFTEIAGHISTFDPATGALLVPGTNGVGKTAGVQPDYRGLAPRLGFALSPSHDFVVRGGYGISFFPMNTTSNANMKDPPFVAVVPNCFLSCAPFAAGYPAITPATLNTPGVTIPDAVDPHFRTSYVHQFNLTVQKQFRSNVATLSYVGLVGRDLAELLPDLNAPPPNVCPGGSTSPCGQALRPYVAVDPNLTTVGFFESHAVSSFNALQASLDRRFTNGLTFNVNYQWAHNLSDATDLSEEDSAGYGQVPSEVRKLDYGNSELDIRHRIAGVANYQLPFAAHSAGITKLAAAGWAVNAIVVWQTGIPFTVLNEANVNGASTGGDRPDVVGNPFANIPPGDFFNPAAFVSQAPGTIGDEGRNAYHGPSFRHVDLSLAKVFPITEGTHLEFRVEGFNVFNTPNFAVPNATLQSPGQPPEPLFGTINALDGNYAPREIQFALKLLF